MSNTTKQTVRQVKGGGAIEWVVTAAESETEGGFRYKVLPAAGIERIGPFISFEHACPAPAAKPLGVKWSVNAAMEVAVVSYAFSVNHTEAPGEAARHCIHAWTAVPVEIIEEWQASGELAAESLPEIDIAGTRIRVVMGDVLGLASPALRGCPASLIECVMPSGAEFAVPRNSPESAVYVVVGEVAIEGREYRAGMMAVIASGWSARMVGKLPSVVIVMGGVPPRISRQSSNWNC